MLDEVKETAGGNAGSSVADAGYAYRASVWLDKGAIRVTQAGESRVGKCEGLMVHGPYCLQHTKDMDNDAGTGPIDMKAKG
jgi:hypothetical protein